MTTIAAFLIEKVNWGLFGTFGMYWLGLICDSSLIFFVTDSLIRISGNIGTINISEKGKLLIGIGSIVLIISYLIYGIVSANRIVHTTYEVKIELDAANATISNEQCFLTNQFQAIQEFTTPILGDTTLYNMAVRWYRSQYRSREIDTHRLESLPDVPLNSLNLDGRKYYWLGQMPNSPLQQ